MVVTVRYPAQVRRDPVPRDAVHHVRSALLAAAHSRSCPSSNPTFPFKAFPMLTSSSSVPGKTTQLTYNDTTTTQKFLIVYYGLETVALGIAQDKTVTLPSDIQGTAYAVVSSSSNTTAVAPT